LLPGCGLKHLLARAGNAYLQVLDTATLADILSGMTFAVPEKDSSENPN
jgi:DNA-binding IscR family transcriptional regulator